MRKIILFLILQIFIINSVEAFSLLNDNNSEPSKLVSEGKIQSAIKVIEKLINEDNDLTSKTFKYFDLYLLEQLNSSPQDLIKITSKYSDSIWKIQIDSKSQKKEFSYRIDIGQIITGYALSITGERKLMNELLFTADEDRYWGENISGMAGMSQLIKANCAALIGETELSLEFLSRARIFLYSSDFTKINNQFFLAHYIQSVAYRFHDKNELEILLSELDETKNLNPTTSFINPYSLLIILSAAYDSGIFPQKRQIEFSHSIREITNRIEINKKSLIYSFADQKEASNYYASTSGTLNRENGIRVPEWVDSDLDPYSLLALGTKLVIKTLESKEYEPEKISEFLSNIDKFKKNRTSDLRFYHQIISNEKIIKSLLYRKQNNYKKEIEELTAYVDQIYLSLWQNELPIGEPIFSHDMIQATVNLYVFRRLIEIDQSNHSIQDLFHLLVQQSNLVKNEINITSQALFSEAKTDLELQYSHSWMSVRSSYENLRKKRLREILTSISFKDNVFQKNENWKEAFIFFEDEIQDLRSKLKQNRKKIFKYFHKLSSISLSKEKTFVWIAESSGLGLILIKQGDKIYINLINSSDVEKLYSISKNFSNRDFDSNTRFLMLTKFSKIIFGDSNIELKNLIYLSGPLVFGMPIGLLKNQSDKFIIEYDDPEVYFSTADYLRAKDKLSINSTIFSNSNLTKYKFLGIGNPIIESSEEIVKAGLTESLIRGGGKLVTSLPALPETEQELKEFSKYSNNSFSLFVGGDATKSKIFGINFSEYEVSSFATHALTSGELTGILYPSLVLSSSKDYDELLTIKDINFLSGMSNVVILSACNTSTKDQNLNQTGINSLATAFYVKGAKSIISSFWQVNSIATKELMSNFAKNYFSLEKSVVLSYWSAVRQIKQEYVDPIDWGAFVPIGNFQSSKIQPRAEYEILTSFAYGVAADENFIYALSVNDDSSQAGTKLTKVSLNNKNKLIDHKEFLIPSDLLNTAKLTANNYAVDIVGTDLDKKTLKIYTFNKSIDYISQLCSKKFNDEIFVIQVHSTRNEVTILLESLTKSTLLIFKKSSCEFKEYISSHHNQKFLPNNSKFFYADSEFNNITLIRSYDNFENKFFPKFEGRLSRINTKIKCSRKSWSEIQFIDFTNKPNLRFDALAISFHLPKISSQNATSKYVNFVEEMPCRISRSAFFSIDLKKFINSTRDDLEKIFESYDGFYNERKDQLSKIISINKKYSLPLSLQETPNGNSIMLGAPSSGHSGVSLITNKLEYVEKGWEILSDAGIFSADDKDIQIGSMIGCAPKETAASNNLFAMTCNVYNSPYALQKIRFFKLN